MNSIVEYAYNQHDVVCNQKYDRVLPYSMHLRYVAAQAKKFRYLLHPGSDFETILNGCGCHDLAEDARMSYNEIKDLAGEKVAEIVFLCTEMRGRTRGERKNDEFYSQLMHNEDAVFVKLCDIIANVSYSALTNSTMLKKYALEYNKVHTFLYRKNFEPMFDYLEQIFISNGFSRTTLRRIV